MAGTSLQYAFLYRIAALCNKIHVLHSWPALAIMCLVQLLYTVPLVTITLAIHKPEAELLLYVKKVGKNAQLARVDFVILHDFGSRPLICLAGKHPQVVSKAKLMV